MIEMNEQTSRCCHFEYPGIVIAGLQLQRDSDWNFDIGWVMILRELVFAIDH
jgi:hypothetical protein